MRIYKELETLGFFEWYCTQYGGLNYTKYKEVYDDLPLDNIIRTELNACVFKFFREKYNLDSFVKHLYKSTIKVGYYFGIDEYKGVEFQMDFDVWYNTYEEAELECLKKSIGTVKVKML
jgi:hypothetical protein